MSADRRKALVTGSSSGIGRAIASRLLAEGFAVVGVSRRAGDLGGDRFSHEAVDLAEIETLPEVLKRLARRHTDCEVIVLCAGQGMFGSLEEFSYVQIRHLMDLNFASQAFLVKAFLPEMKRRRQGQVIFVGSEAAHVGTARGTIYCASKFALRGFAQALRQEASGSGIRISFISPGMTRTPFYDELSFEPGADAENALEANDVAEAVALVVRSRAESVFDEIRLSPLKRVVRRRSS